MIYTKRANFPYPVLMNFSNDYRDAEFELDVDMSDNTEEYIFEITYKISSQFILDLLEEGKANMYVIVKSKDNTFRTLDIRKKKKVITIPKNRLSVGERTSIQLMIQTTEKIGFAENQDLDEFFDSTKEQIEIEPGNALGFSNTVVFDGSQTKPYELFEKCVNSKQAEDISISLNNEVIIISYKIEEYQFIDSPISRELNYPYVYMGLQKALMKFIISQNPEHPDEGVALEEINEPETALDNKLYQLMVSKKIKEISFDTIDEVIFKISDKLIKKYTDKVRGLHHDH